MRRRNEQSLVLLCALVVFACLLIAGRSRLVGYEVEENALPSAAGPVLRAALCSAPAAPQETGGMEQQTSADKRQSDSTVCASPTPQPLALCDANGNVLGNQTYLHAVYQAFALGDGFA